MWKIRRDSKETSVIQLMKVEDEGTGDILSQEYLTWRRELAARQQDVRVAAVSDSGTEVSAPCCPSEHG